MIAFIDGKVVSYQDDTVVLDHDGMGWEIHYPHIDQIHREQEIRIFTYLSISENDMRLYGFSSQDEKNLFLKLISVKGLGPKTAMNMLAKKGYREIIAAIENGDVKFLKGVPGIGPKAASQIVLDLKGKLVPVDQKEKAEELPPEIQDAADALKNFGYRQGEIQKAVNIMKESPGKTVQDYIRIGLRALVK
jgi:Holliday junction DNA helicase RuvA